MNYMKLCEEILPLIGGKENIAGLTHCVTRLRFRLVDSKKAKKDEVQKLDSVMGVVEQGGQFQIIIGKEVDAVFKEMQKLTGIQEGGNDAVEETQVVKKGQMKNPWDVFTSTISALFTPFLGAFAACGVLKGLLALATTAGIMDSNMGVYIVLNAIGDSIYYFMPLVLGVTAAERFGINKFVGLLVGASMIYPTIVASVDTGLTFLHIPMQTANYTSTVFPAICAVYLASLIYKGFDRVCPKVIRYFTVPLVTLVITVPISLIVIGPVVNKVSEILMQIMNAIYGFSPVLCALVLGGPWMILVMFGLHWAFVPLFINEITATGSCAMMSICCANQFAFAGAMLAVGLKSKHDLRMRSLGVSTGVTCILGVSEPGMYGVLLPLKKPFITALIASSIGAVPAALMGTKVYVAGASGIFGIPGLIGPAGVDMGFIGALISCTLGLVLGFVMTCIWGMPKKGAVKNGE